MGSLQLLWGHITCELISCLTNRSTINPFLCTLIKTHLLTHDAVINTELRTGLSSQEAESRRKRYGFNEISSEKTNLLKQFIGYFTGPILYGMQICTSLIAMHN